MAFLAPRFRSARASKRPRHRRKETLVARRDRPPPKTREILTTFEPSRLSSSWVAQAYEQIVPIVRRTTSKAPASGRHSPQPSEIGRVERVTASRE
jgi:hypothetical protein